jgi:lipid-A-disaccharide synthase
MAARVLIVAGEASADLHASEVMRALPEASYWGVGGPRMRARGFEAVANAEDISVAGLTEVLWSLPRKTGE